MRDMVFEGYVSGTDIPVAAMRAEVDESSVSTTRLGGKLVFGTTADGANTVSDRMVIEKDGDVVINVLTLYVLATWCAILPLWAPPHPSERRAEIRQELCTPQGPTCWILLGTLE